MFVVVCAVIYGTVLASFVTLVGYRVPLGISVSNPPSHCSSCKKELRYFDLVPVFSYMFNRGKCRMCGVSYGSFHFWMELFVALLFGLVAYAYLGDWYSVASGVTFILMINMNYIALKVHGVLLRRVTLIILLCMLPMAYLSVFGMYLVGIGVVLWAINLVTGSRNFSLISHYFAVVALIVLCVIG